MMRTLAITAAAAGLFAISAPAASFYVAREAVRALKRQAPPAPAGAMIIYLRGGDYFRTNSFELDAADSGTPVAPVTWRAAAGETVRFLGGRTGAEDIRPDPVDS